MTEAAWFVLGGACGVGLSALLAAAVLLIPSKRVRVARRFSEHKHGDRAEAAMGLPATPYQVRRLRAAGLAAGTARRMTRLEASVEIARRSGQ